MIFLLFIFIPIIEIAIFISIGSNIGILNTVAIILITALVGIFLVRRQGMSLLFNAQRNMSQGIMPTEEIKGGIFLLISGLLLITPGFFTDAVGFALLTPPLRQVLIRRWLAGRAVVSGHSTQGKRHSGVVEGEFRRIDD